MDETLWCLFCGIIIIGVDLNSSHGLISDSGSHPFWRSKRQSCGSTEFRCSSGQCIDDTAVCDGVKDCNDGSDETSGQCINVRCPPFAFKCNYGGCVDGRALCNGITECIDGSDEDRPSCIKRPNNGNCKNDQFRCQSGKCIDSTLLCDGIRDCDDGSDETFSQCNNFRCPPFTFRCSYGGCIDRTGRCDGRPQCADSSDEDPVLCGTPVKPSCKLPDKPQHGDFSIQNCAGGDNSPLCQKVAGTLAPDFTILNFQCNPGYKMAGTYLNPCVNGAWSNPHPTCEAVLCPKLESVSVDIRCSLKGNKVDCNKPMAPGTEALLACKIAYQLTNEPGYDKVICNSEGNWDKPVFTCFQECGKRNPNGKPFVSGGEEAKVGEFPWHVGIYRLEKSGELQQICGGSLVNPNTVISAAHCFWDENFRKTRDKSMFKVAAGKYYRDWNRKDEEMQERELSDIVVHENYRGRPGLFANDIAIIKLNISVQLTWAVLPVCLDLKNEYERFQLSNGQRGTIVGWGVTEKNEASAVLITTQLPFVDFATCWSTVPETFQAYVSKDKFCAGYTNGTSVCPGDSGGGLAFERNNLYYLRGIVSIGVEPKGSQKCFTDQYTAFTKVSDFLPWMEPYIR